MRCVVKDVMSHAVSSVSLSFTLDRLESVMARHKIHCLPVIDNAGQCFGVISSTDLVYWHSRQLNIDELKAWEVCTQPVIEVSPNLSMMEAAELMIANNVHHLIVTQDGVVTGIVSSMDVMQLLIAQDKDRKCDKENR